MKNDKLVAYLRTTEGLLIRATGFLGLVKDNCIACSAYPDNVEPALKDVTAGVDRIDQLVQMLVKGEK